MSVWSQTKEVGRQTGRVPRWVGYYAGRTVMVAAAAIPGAAMALGALNFAGRVLKGHDIAPDMIGWGHQTVDPLLQDSNPGVQAMGLVAETGVVAADVANTLAELGEEFGGVVGDWAGAQGTGETIGRLTADAVIAVGAGVAATKLLQRVPIRPPELA